MWEQVGDTISFRRAGASSESPCFGQCLCYYIGSSIIMQVTCVKKIPATVVCELRQSITYVSMSRNSILKLQSFQSFGQDLLSNTSFLACPLGHFTRTFLACDILSACWNQGTLCRADLTPLPPSFVCEDKLEQIPYTLVCDHKTDCYDSSDEQFCHYKPCASSVYFECKNKEACDIVPHCSDSSDEQCGPRIINTYSGVWIPPPAILNFDIYGTVTGKQLMRSANSSMLICPDTHVQCADDGDCLPVFVWCNTIHDCPQHEDEEHCEKFTCSGFYRCWASSVCLHPQHVCDGMYHCPQRDDELLCDRTCPEQCTCYGQAFFCDSVISPSSYPELGYLDASDSGLQYVDVSRNEAISFLRLCRCGLINLTLHQFPNLYSLDLSENNLTLFTDQHLSLLTNLRRLTLSDNPLTTLIQHTSETPYVHHNLQSLDVSKVIMEEVDVTILNTIPNLVTLNFTDCALNRLVSGGFQSLSYLAVLDMRGCSLEYFSGGIFQGLSNLHTVFADNYKLCCEAILPQSFRSDHCHAPSDYISSCKALLRSNIYRVTLVIFSVLAIVGNITSFCFRLITIKLRAKLGFDIFVSNLCVSDFLMGLYLSIIGMADRAFYGTFLWKDVTWKQGVACHMAGFLALLSSEVSAFIICIITLDRVLVLRFPFSQLHFRGSSALMTCAVVWTVGLIIAAIPVLPMTSHWKFYGQNSVCIPLPITRTNFPGRAFAFNVMIVMNFVLFLLIAIGQAAIYQSVQQNKLSTGECSTSNKKDRTLARRLLTIAISDFLCWFPVGVLGLLSSSGQAVSSEVNVAMAILVLPLNSAINPFLYTLNMVMERLYTKRQQRMQQLLFKQLQGQNTESKSNPQLLSCPTQEAEQRLTVWLYEGLLSRRYVAGVLCSTNNQERN